VEQLAIWGARLDIPVIKQGQGADSASVIFDALKSAQAKDIDILIADTAGRLHTQNNLMDELEKIKRVMGKLDPSAPHEIMLVLDAGTGQNALAQATHFKQAIGVTGITLTKLDGTAKGGMIFSVSEQLQLPIRYIGVGESVDDLLEFNSEEFVDALLSELDRKDV
jgi:fused signal recognition particle receptor